MAILNAHVHFQIDWATYQGEKSLHVVVCKYPCVWTSCQFYLSYCCKICIKIRNCHKAIWSCLLTGNMDTFDRNELTRAGMLKGWLQYNCKIYKILIYMVFQ